MCKDSGRQEFSLLFFPKHEENTFAMYVSSPPPTWLSGDDMTKVVIEAPGVYCLFFLVASQSGGRAYITVNGREIRGSYAEARAGAISGSAVCSIREKALPCSLEIRTENNTAEGVLLVAKCEI